MTGNVAPHQNRRAAGLAALLAVGSCGPPKAATVTTPEPPPPETPPPSRLDAVWVLESSGVRVDDTSFTMLAGQPRVIILRRGPPDNSRFAQVSFPTGVLQSSGAGTDSVAVTIRPRPGVYGLDLDVPGQVGVGAAITFSYAMSFVVPAGARERYGSALVYERALYVARIDADDTVVFLPTTRPGSDLLSAPIRSPGRYLVVAPK